METFLITNEDKQLIELAKAVITESYQYGRHHIAAALRTADGTVFTALHLDATVRRAAICAEAAVLSRAISEGADKLDTIVAVRHPRPDEEDQTPMVVSPCGICRELLVEYGNELKVIVPDSDGTLRKCNILELLPYRFNHA